MVNINMNQFTKFCMRNYDVCNIMVSVGFDDSSSRTSSCEFSAIGYNPSDIFVCNEVYRDGSIN